MQTNRISTIRGFAIFALIVFLAIGLFSACTTADVTPVKDSAGPEHAEPLSIEGLWKQYMMIEEDWIYGGTFIVTEENGVYAMDYYEEIAERQVASDSYIADTINSRGLFDITFDNNVWTFKSDWGNTGIGEFRLMPRYPDIFEGYSYLDGQRRTFNRWEKVE